MFFASLITHVPPGARLLRCFEEETPDEAAVAAGRRALSARAGSTASNAPGPGGGGGGRDGAPGWGAHMSYEPCAYPELERFVCSVCCEVGAALEEAAPRR